MGSVLFFSFYIRTSDFVLTEVFGVGRYLVEGGRDGYALWAMGEAGAA